MTDAPHRIWATHNYVSGMSNVLSGEFELEPSAIVKQTEYIRADLHAEAIEAAEQRGYARGIEATVEVVNDACPDYEGGCSLQDQAARDLRDQIAMDISTLPHTPPALFQNRVAPWMQACFGPEISSDVSERNHRFLEEALELVQAKGCSASEAHQLVDYVYSRDVGEPHQEVGGVMVTLAALCLAADLDMQQAGEDELARIWTKVEKIRAKQAAKPKNSPLPQHTPPPPASVTVQEAAQVILREIDRMREADEPIGKYLGFFFGNGGGMIALRALAEQEGE